MKKIVNTHLISGHGYWLEGLRLNDFELVTNIILYIYEDGMIGYRAISKYTIDSIEEDSTVDVDSIIEGMDKDEFGNPACTPLPFIYSYNVYGSISKQQIESIISSDKCIYINRVKYTDVEEAISVFKSHGVRVI